MIRPRFLLHAVLRTIRRAALVVAAIVVLLQHAAGAQSFTFSILERYFEQLRQQAGIPGMSAVVVYDRDIAWRHGFGYSDVDNLIAARDDTTYLIGDVTQTFAAVMLLRCIEHGTLKLTDRVPGAGGANVLQTLAHVSPSGGDFRYDPAQFARLTPTVDACGTESARLRVARDVFDHLVMHDSVPGRDVLDPESLARPSFAESQLDRYENALSRLAVPYRVDQRRRATRSEMPPKRLDASMGLVSSARDLGQYVAAFADDRLLLDANSVEDMWSNRTTPGVTRPTGLGWFVQQYNGERLVWHFGLVPDAYSALILHVPAKKLTLVLLANSDGLSAPFDLAQGDVTRSVFALAFLRLYL